MGVDPLNLVLDHSVSTMDCFPIASILSEMGLFLTTAFFFFFFLFEAYFRFLPLHYGISCEMTLHFCYIFMVISLYLLKLL